MKFKFLASCAAAAVSFLVFGSLASAYTYTYVTVPIWGYRLPLRPLGNETFM